MSKAIELQVIDNKDYKLIQGFSNLLEKAWITNSDYLLIHVAEDHASASVMMGGRHLRLANLHQNLAHRLMRVLSDLAEIEITGDKGEPLTGELGTDKISLPCGVKSLSLEWADMDSEMDVLTIHFHKDENPGPFPMAVKRSRGLADLREVTAEAT